MKATLTLLISILATLTLYAQGVVEYVDDEECGCELVFIDGIQTTRQGDLHGFRLADGTVIVENRYKYVDQFHGNYCKVYLDYGKCGLIDREGTEVVPCIYDDVGYPSCNRVRVESGGRIGFCNMHGEVEIPLIYGDANDYHCGLAAVSTNPTLPGTCLYIDTNGTTLPGGQYDATYDFENGYAIVGRGGEYGIIDSTGENVLPLIYPIILRAGGTQFFAGTESGLSLFGKGMHPLTPFCYTDALPSAEGLTAVMQNGKWGFIDTAGREVVPCIYDEVGPFLHSRTMVREGEHYGIIDNHGRIVLPIVYERKIPLGKKYMFYDGRALVEQNGKVGYVDLDGNIVIPLLFERAYEFSQGFAAVRHNGMWGYIDTAGDIYIPPLFDVASPFRWGRADVVFGGNRSKIDLRGKCVKNCKGIIAWREIEKE